MLELEENIYLSLGIDELREYVAKQFIELFDSKFYK